MRARLDQVMVWLEQGRAVVQVEYADALGRARRETFHPPTKSLPEALKAVARELGGRGMVGPCRVRLRRGSRLEAAPELQKLFLGHLAEDD